MEKYDYSNLTPQDFEIFCKDILEKVENKKFRTYAEGMDDGVDIECLETDDFKIIAQAKRWIKTKFDINKINKIKGKAPDRYILFITKEITKNQKDKLLEKFNPYLSLADIYDEIRLNDFLNKSENKDILEKWEKLWLPSNIILKKIFDKFKDAKYNYNQNKIIFNNKIYVKTSYYNKAVDILNKENILIIHGNPGVGKTSLAEILVKEYLKKDFEFIYGEMESLNEIEDKIYSNEKTVILIDDFLGDTEVQLNKISDNKLKNIIEYCKSSQNKKIIFTTRTYIYTSALSILEKFSMTIKNNTKLLVDVTRISNYEKAQILYNHLFYNNIINTDQYKEILRDKFYFKIIEHQNFTPRIISLICDDLKNMEIKDLKNKVIDSLNDINVIWEREYSKLTDKEKILLLVLTINNSVYLYENNYEYIKLTFVNLYNNQILNNDFKKCIKKLSDSFVSTTIIDINKKNLQISNPSIKDFIKHKIKSDDIEISLEEYLNKSIYLEDIYSVSNLKILNDKIIKDLILNKFDVLLSYKKNKRLILYMIIDNLSSIYFEDVLVVKLLKIIINDAFENIIFEFEDKSNDIQLILKILVDLDYDSEIFIYTKQKFIEIELDYWYILNEIYEKDILTKYLEVLKSISNINAGYEKLIIEKIKLNEKFFLEKLLEIINYEIEYIGDDWIDYFSYNIDDDDFKIIKEETNNIVDNLFEDDFKVIKELNEEIFDSLINNVKEKRNNCIEEYDFSDKLNEKILNTKNEKDLSEVSINQNYKDERKKIVLMFEKNTI
ncbi:MAG: restriction endonuclease [Candidatus Nanoarchaeia archaeon]|nr:restriction endonuclease [Candidatus Nanoarchaeia archaeon]